MDPVLRDTVTLRQAFRDRDFLRMFIKFQELKEGANTNARIPDSRGR